MVKRPAMVVPSSGSGPSFMSTNGSPCSGQRGSSTPPVGSPGKAPGDLRHRGQTRSDGERLDGGSVASAASEGIGGRVVGTQPDASSLITQTAARGKRAFCLEKSSYLARSLLCTLESSATRSRGNGFRHACCALKSRTATRAPPTYAYTRAPVVDLAVAVVVDRVAAKFMSTAFHAGLVRANEAFVARRRPELAFIDAANLFGFGRNPKTAADHSQNAGGSARAEQPTH